MANYVVSDLHGHYDKLMKMLEKIKFTDADHLYILGDVVDRGPHGIKIINWVIEQNNVTLLMGNHEYMMIEAEAGNIQALEVRTMNGGLYTLAEKKEDKIAYLKALEFIKGLPLYSIVENYVLVHAGIQGPTKRSLIKDQDEEDMLWSRETFYNNEAIEDMIVVFGHTPTHYIDKDNYGKIWHDKTHHDKIGIDCGVYYENGNLGCLRLDDLEEFYV